MREFNDHELNNVMNMIGQSLEHAKEQLRQNSDTDQYRFLRIFRDSLVDNGVDAGYANKVAATFDIELTDGALDNDDLTNAAEQFADWTVQMIDLLQEVYEGDDLIMEIVKNPGLSLKL